MECHSPAGIIADGARLNPKAARSPYWPRIEAAIAGARWGGAGLGGHGGAGRGAGVPRRGFVRFGRWGAVR